MKLSSVNPPRWRTRRSQLVQLTDDFRDTLVPSRGGWYAFAKPSISIQEKVVHRNATSCHCQWRPVTEFAPQGIVLTWDTRPLAFRRNVGTLCDGGI